MDDGERIPIDLGYEVASTPPAASEGSAQRMTLREDGTLVIDILAEQPCAPSSEGEIVVCAAAEDGSQYLPPPPPPAEPTAMEKLGEALNVQLGPVELGSIDRGNGTRAFGARVRF